MPLPNLPPRIIKQPHRDTVVATSVERQTFTEAPLRIPGRHVNLDGEPEEAPVFNPRDGILPRQRASLEPEPVTLPVVDFEPDFLVAPASPPEPPAPDPTEEAEAAPPPEDPEADWQARLDEAVAQARQEGFEMGLAAAREEMERNVADIRNAFVEDLRRIEAAVETFYQRTEPQLAALAFHVAEAILRAPLPEQIRAVSERFLTEAVERATAETTADVSLHPVDYLRLQENGVVERLSALHSGLRWHPDPDLKQGDWIVSSPLTTTRRIEAELLDALRSQLGLTEEGERGKETTARPN